MPDENAPITDPDALKQFLHAPMENVPQGTGGAMRDLLPLATQALQFGGPSASEQLIQENLRPGIPIEVNPPRDAFAEGVMGNVSPWTRFQTARRQTLEDQQKYLESKFPGKVRKAKNSDDFLIEIPDPVTGKSKEVVLNEEQITLGDAAALLGHAPEIGSTLIAAALGGKAAALAKAPKAVQTLVQLLSGSIGYKAGQAGEQIETRKEQGQPLEAGKVLSERVKELPGQAAMDLATFGIFKTGSVLKRVAQSGPGMFKTAAQTEGLPAEAALRAKTGQGISYSASESSGMPLMAFTEAYAAAKPQSTPIMQAFKDTQLREIRALGDALKPGAGTDEEAGQRLLDFLTANQTVREQQLAAIRKTMTKQESAALTKQLGKIAPVAQSFEPSAAGGAFRNEIQGAHTAVKARVGQAYTDAYGVPGAAIPAVPTKPITDEIERLTQQFPTVEGAQWLKNYKNTFAGQESYKDIVERRSDLWRKIEESPADRSTKDYIHGQLSNAMTTTLDDATKTIINPQFRGLIQHANELYKKEQLPFYQEGMYDILRKAGVRGAPENMELIDRFKANTDLYRRLVSVVGKNSEPVKVINSAVIDGLLAKSGTSAIDPQFIDGKQLFKNLTDMASSPKTREMFNDIFGSNAKTIREQAKVLAGIQGTIPKEEAEAFLTGGASAASRRRLARVMAVQEQADTVEAKRLLKVPVDEIQPEKLINGYTDKLTESELKQLAARIENDAPALYTQLQDKQTEQILGKAGNYQTWTRTKLENVLHDPKWEPKYRAILGPEKFGDLELFAKALGPIEYSAGLAEGTGMLVKGQSIGSLADVFKIKPGGRRSGSTVGKIITKGMEEVPGWIGWKLAARAITSGAVRDYFAKDFAKESPNLVWSTLVTEPFLADIASSSSSPTVVRNVAMAVRDWGKRVAQPPQAPQQDNAPITDPNQLRKFLKE